MSDPGLDDAEIEAVALLLRDQGAAKVDRLAVLSALRDYFRTVRYHLDPKLAPLRTAWVKLAPGEPLPPTPRLTIGPSRPRRR